MCSDVVLIVTRVNKLIFIPETLIKVRAAKDTIENACDALIIL